MKLKKTAIVLSGGGTRGAYEAGVIQYLRSVLPKSLSKPLHFDFIVGCSVGAINGSFMAAFSHEPKIQGDELVKIWRQLRSEDIYRRGPVHLGKLIGRSALGLLSHLVGVKGAVDPSDTALMFQAIFDTQPFFHFLVKNCPWPMISKNIEQQFLSALVISATNVQTGNIELFVDKSKDLLFRSQYKINEVKISPRHVMASAALPVLFPAVPIQGIYYNDGGLRMKTPLAPALGFDAQRILVIGTRGRELPKIAELSQPGLGTILGRMFGAVFQDRLDTDMAQLARINRVLEICQEHLDPRQFKVICDEAQIQPIETLFIEPTEDISSFVDDTLRASMKKVKNFGILEKSILRLLEIDVQKGSDLLSYFLFEPGFVNKLIELGYEDARRNHDRLVAFAENA